VTRVEIARLFLFVRESAENNHGLRVEAIEHWGGGDPGQSWCCYFATLVLDLEFQGRSPIPRLGECQEVLDLARRNGWVIPAPEVGCLVISLDANGHAHHIGICTGTAPLATIAGNTSEDGVSVNGTGVFAHEISPNGKVYVRVPTA
jgi:hypothetical protein